MSRDRRRPCACAGSPESPGARENAPCNARDRAPRAWRHRFPRRLRSRRFLRGPCSTLQCAAMLTGLRGVDIGVRDVAAAARFFTDVWRLVPVAERNGAIYLRGSSAYHHILALHPREEAQLLCINLAARDRQAVE